MIEFICLFYYMFSVLFMIGYVDSRFELVWVKIIVYLSLLVVSPIMFPINIGYYVYKNS